MSPEQKLALLRPIATFAVLDSVSLRTLAADADVLELAEGQVLFQAGEASDGGYVIAAGALDLISDEPGSVMRRVGAGALVGEMALLVELPRPAQAIAAETTLLLYIRRAHFLKVLSAAPQASVRLKELFARRLDSFLGELDQVRNELEHFRPSPRRPS